MAVQLAPIESLLERNMPGMDTVRTLLPELEQIRKQLAEEEPIPVRPEPPFPRDKNESP